MSIKTTQHISRQRAIEVLIGEICLASDTLLEELLDALADSGESKTFSIYDNFMIVPKTEEKD